MGYYKYLIDTDEKVIYQFNNDRVMSQYIKSDKCIRIKPREVKEFEGRGYILKYVRKGKMHFYAYEVEYFGGINCFNAPVFHCFTCRYTRDDFAREKPLLRAACDVDFVRRYPGAPLIHHKE